MAACSSDKSFTIILLAIPDLGDLGEWKRWQWGKIVGLGTEDRRRESRFKGGRVEEWARKKENNGCEKRKRKGKAQWKREGRVKVIEWILKMDPFQWLFTRISTLFYIKYGDYTSLEDPFFTNTWIIGLYIWKFKKKKFNSPESRVLPLPPGGTGSSWSFSQGDS